MDAEKEYLDYQKLFIHPEHQNKLIKLLKDVTDILTENKITYWIDGGTLLGAVRSGGQMEHDDDNDLGIFNSDYKNLVSLSNQFIEKGYKVKQENNIFKIYTDNLMENKYRYSRNPCLDIFCWHEEKKIIKLYDPNLAKIWKQCYHKVKDFYPLKEYKYNDIKVMGVNNPLPYLCRMYNGWTEYIMVDEKVLKDKNTKHIFDMKLMKEYLMRETKEKKK